MTTFPAPKPFTFDEMADRALGVRALADALMAWTDVSSERAEAWAALAVMGLDPIQTRLCAYVGAEELCQHLNGPDSLNAMTPAQRLNRVRIVEDVLRAIKDAAAGWRPEAMPTARAQMARDHHAADQSARVDQMPPVVPRLCSAPMGDVIPFADRLPRDKF
jgi:hypothetical protein